MIHVDDAYNPRDFRNVAEFVENVLEDIDQYSGGGCLEAVEQVGDNCKDALGRLLMLLNEKNIITLNDTYFIVKGCKPKDGDITKK